MSDETKLNPEVSQMAEALSKNMSIGEAGTVEVHMDHDLEAKMRFNALINAHTQRHVKIYNNTLHVAIRAAARKSMRRTLWPYFKRRSLMSFINQAMPDYQQILKIQEFCSSWKKDPQLQAILRGCRNRQMRGKYVYQHKGHKPKRGNPYRSR